MSANRIHFRGTATRHGEALSRLRSAGDAVIVERGTVRSIIVCCPCGCREPLPINLDSRAGPAWRLYRDRPSSITLFPSIWRESGCGSHFIVWRGRVYMIPDYDSEFDNAEPSKNVEQELRDAIIGALPESDLTPFAVIAERLRAIPWDVLSICRGLVKAGAAREGRGAKRGSFGRL